MEPFKNLLNPALVRATAQRLRAVSPGFDAQHFEQVALHGLESLELKARAMQIATALEATLPHGNATRFAQACDVIEAALGAPVSVDGLTTPPLDIAQGLAGWIVWPLGEFVARAGIKHPQRALLALHALTQRLTAEFAIRPFIVAHPQLVLNTLQRWTTDPSPHVRRLCSEGSRPRLPWGLQLKALVADPTPTLPILAALQDDPSAYVRRSVANHLNDIAKDHPQLVVQWVQQHLADASREREALLRHASRTLVKQGHAAMLDQWGTGSAFDGKATLTLTPARVRIGAAVTMQLKLRSTASTPPMQEEVPPQRLVVDVVVHYVKASGTTSPKVFKGWTLELAAGETRELMKTLPMREVSIRKLFVGKHRVAVQVNGKVVVTRAFDLVSDG